LKAKFAANDLAIKKHEEVVIQLEGVIKKREDQIS